MGVSWVKYLLVITNALLLCGCVVAHTIKGVQDVGITESGRRQSIETTVKRFNKALFWNNERLILTFVKEENAQRVRQHLPTVRHRYARVVGSNILDIVFGKDSKYADVYVRHRVLDKSTNLIFSEDEHQGWEHTIPDGWKLVMLEEVKGRQGF